jgi:putative tricarboxylic transport membrane protein
MAVFLGALLLHGIWPGPGVLTDNTVLVFVIAQSILVSNILTSVIGLSLAEEATKILKTPIPLVLTGITVLALVSVLVVRNSATDMLLTVVFTAFGLLLVGLEINRIPFLIAFVLSSILERQFHLARRFAGNDVTEALFGSQLDLILIGIFAVSLLFLLIPREKLLDPLMPS